MNCLSCLKFWLSKLFGSWNSSLGIEKGKKEVTRKMDQSSCKNCADKSICKDSFASWIFFVIGIIATIAIRIVTLIMHLNPFYGKISWYIGVGGFFIFFMYKFKALNNRSKKIIQQDLLRKIEKKEKLTDEDYYLVETILCNISSNKERINYFFIFGLSAIALIIAIYIDFFI